MKATYIVLLILLISCYSESEVARVELPKELEQSLNPDDQQICRSLISQTGYWCFQEGNVSYENECVERAINMTYSTYKRVLHGVTLERVANLSMFCR